MIIVGAKGFAKELLEVCYQLGKTDNLVFFDNVSNDLPDFLYGQFPIIRSEKEVNNYFRNTDKAFALGLGNPELRKKMASTFTSWGGELYSIISPNAFIGSFGTIVNRGTTIMTGTAITNDVYIHEGCLINLNCTIGHDTVIGSYSELCPGVHLSGNVSIGNQCFIGTGAVILPGIQIGNNAVIGAGTVVTKDVADNSLIVGIPGKEMIAK